MSTKVACGFSYTQPHGCSASCFQAFKIPIHRHSRWSYMYDFAAIFVGMARTASIIGGTVAYYIETKFSEGTVMARRCTKHESDNAVLSPNSY